MKKTALYGIVILVGAIALALFGTGIATFARGEDLLRRQKDMAVSIRELGSVSGETKAFQLVVKEPEVTFVCRPELMNKGEQPLPEFELILVNDLPDRPAPELVSFSGCPLTDRCANRTAETY